MKIGGARSREHMIKLKPRKQCHAFMPYMKSITTSHLSCLKSLTLKQYLTNIFPRGFSRFVLFKKFGLFILLFFLYKFFVQNSFLPPPPLLPSLFFKTICRPFAIFCLKTFLRIYSEKRFLVPKIKKGLPCLFSNWDGKRFRSSLFFVSPVKKYPYFPKPYYHCGKNKTPFLGICFLNSKNVLLDMLYVWFFVQ